ncbi:hypothetical protein HDU83_005467 [Entophlyctis luteolus]|nr:hypothetical protein HDU83_005467 [Entophlyctis luteolus]
MLNCGGIIDIAAMLSIPPQATVYIVDSHRPLHLGSIYKYEQVMVLDDGEIEGMKDVEEAFNAIEMRDLDNEESDAENDSSVGDNDGSVDGAGYLQEDDRNEDVDDDDTGDESDFELVGDHDQRRKRKKSQSSLDMNPDGSGNASPTGSENYAAKRRKSIEQRRARSKHVAILTKYYEEGSYHGMSASQIIYMMLTQLGRVSSDALWLSIIALTDQYLHERIDIRSYKSSVIAFKDDATKFDLDGNIPSRNHDAIHFESDNASVRANEDNEQSSRPVNFAAAGQFGSKSADDRSIESTEELHLIQYVAARLGTWKEKGKQKLTNLLARMGLPHVQTHQPFHEMKLTVQKELRSKLLNIGPSFRMTELQYPSFVRHNGFKITVSASDSVHAILALLDCGAGWMRRHAGVGSGAAAAADEDTAARKAAVGSENSSAQTRSDGEHRRTANAALSAAALTGTGIGQRLGVGAVRVKVSEFDDVGSAGGVDGFEPPVPGEDEADRNAREDRNRRRERENEWVKNFYLAYDALDNIQFQKVLVHTGMSLIERQMCKKMRTFRFAVAHNASGSGRWAGGMVGDSDTSIFGRSIPLLNRLAIFMMETFRENKKKQLPMVLAAFNEDSDSFLVLGVPVLKRGQTKNTFGLSFLKAAQRTNTAFRSDAFDNSITEIPKDDLLDFVEALQTLV